MAGESGWTSIGPPGLISESVVRADPAWPGRVYAAGYHQVFVSLDAGKQFFATPGEATVPYAYQHIRDLAVLRRPGDPVPGQPPRLLVATDQGLRMSTDGGASYIAVDQGLAPTVVGHRLHPAPANDTDVYLLSAGERNLYRSADGGARWSRVELPVPFYPSALAVASANGATAVVGGAEGVFRTTDYGATWTDANNGLPAAPYADIALASDPDRPSTLAIVLPGHGVYVSTNAGVRWARVSSLTPGLGAPRSLVIDGDKLWLITQQLDRSVDGGRTWTTLHDVGGGATLAVDRDRRTGRLYAIRPAGDARDAWHSDVWYSDDDGSTWLSARSGLNGSSVSSLLADATGAIYVHAGSPAALLKFDPDQQHWQNVGPPACRSTLSAKAVKAIVTAHGSLVADCASTETGTLSHAWHESVDGGTTWHPTSAGHVGLLQADPVVEGTFYGTEVITGTVVPGTGGAVPMFDTLQVSRDDGRTWRSLHAGLPVAFRQGTLALHVAGGGRLLVNNVWFSPDDGASWQRNDLPDGVIWDAVSTPQRPEVIVVALNDRIFRSGDGGRRFALLGMVPADAAPVGSFTSAPKLALDPEDVDALYFVDAVGQVFVTTDGTSTWSKRGTALRNGGVIVGVALPPKRNRTLYAATHGSGVVTLPTQPGLEVASEFHHPTFDHYFVTTEPVEATSLSLGNLPPWIRTGRSWSAWRVGTVGTQPVCRFFSAAFAPKSSHFYTPYAEECTGLKQAGSWTFESNAFGLVLPSGPTGAGTCAPGMQPLYRAYNNGRSGAPNHRYATDAQVLQAMIAQGWTMEGEASTSVFACVPR